MKHEIIAGTLLLAAVASAGAEPPREPIDAGFPAPAFEVLDEHRLRIGNLTLDRRTREIRVPAEFVLRDGPLEYVACAPDGKLYESLLSADVDPHHLQFALLLLGLEPTNDLEAQGEAVQVSGDAVTVLVSWRDGVEQVTHRVERLVRERASGKEMQQTDFVFSGSRIFEGVFLAALERSLVAVYNDPAAILNNPLATGTDDTSYRPNPDLVPAVGTRAEIILRAGRPDRGD